MTKPNSSPTILPADVPAVPAATMDDWPARLICGHYSARKTPRDPNAAKAAQASQNAFKGYLSTLAATGSLPARPDDRTDVVRCWAYDAAETVRRMVGRQDGLVYGVLRTGVSCDLPGARGTADALWLDSLARRVTLCEYTTFYQPGRDAVAKLAGCALGLRSGLKWTPTAYRLVQLCGEQHTAGVVTLTYGECREYCERALAVQAARDGGGPLTLCQSDWCPRCAHAEGCPAYREIAETVRAAGPLAHAPADWPSLATDKKAQLVVLADTVSQWADAIRKAAKADLLAGSPIKDDDNAILYVLRTDRGRRIPRCLDARHALLTHGVPLCEVDGACSIPAAAIRRLLAGRGVAGRDAEQIVTDVSDVGPDVVKMVRG